MLDKTMTTTTEIPLGHKTLKLSELNPKQSPSFSPNLYKWMREHAHFYKDGGVAETVYRVKPNTPSAKHFGANTKVIGYPINGYEGDTDFSGALLIGVLCNGVNEKRACYAGLALDVELVDNFWEQYLDIGRCAIDPEHKEHFINGERYVIEGDTRTCLWCNAKQKRVLTNRVVIDESWI